MSNILKVVELTVSTIQPLEDDRQIFSHWQREGDDEAWLIWFSMLDIDAIGNTRGLATLSLDHKKVVELRCEHSARPVRPLDSERLIRGK